MAAAPGHQIRLELTGTAVTLTTEATSDLGSDVHQITDAAKRVLDPATAVVIADSGGTVPASEYTIDYLFGKVSFSTAPTGAVTVSGKYLPRVEFGCARACDVNLSRDALDRTCFQPDAAAGTAHRQHQLGLITAEGSVEDIDVGVDTLYGSETLREEVMHNATANQYWVLSVEFSSTNIFRAFVQFIDLSTSLSIDELLASTLNWQLHAIEDVGYFSEIS